MKNADANNDFYFHMISKSVTFDHNNNSVMNVIFTVIFHVTRVKC